MNARTHHLSRLTACLVVVCMLVGCSHSESDSAGQSDPAANRLTGPDSPDSDNSHPTETGPVTETDESGTQSVPAQPPDSQSGETKGAGLPLADPSLNLPERPLPANLSPEKLVEFLAGADQDMQLIASGRGGISDPNAARAVMKRITKLKLEASRRLKKHPDADAKSQIEAARGELQSLSTLASLGDVKSADALEALANENLNSNDPNLLSDSRMVLIGFAIESLQNGNEDAADKIAELIADLTDSSSPPDVPAMMVMGQARQVLAQFGHDEKAKGVRDRIIELFANSSDPQIAKLAAQVAGNVRYDSIDKLRAAAVNQETVSIDRWREAVTALIDESPDLMTVGYLAGAALEFEAVSNDELATATYGIMTDRFSDPEEATTREVNIAVQAREARRGVVGKEFDPDLPSTGGTKISMADYRGKVVLMPFWATGFPESLQVIPMLTKLRDDNPEKIAIIGMNLDPAGASIDAYADKELGFPSYRSESTEAATMGNPIAARFGVVSMPFVAIIDQAGRIEAIDFSGHKLEPTIKRLLAQEQELEPLP